MFCIIYIIIFSAYFPKTAALSGAFILGILNDLWNGERLGSSSLIFVLLAFAITLYKRKFNARAPGFLVVASTIGILAIKGIMTGGRIFSFQFLTTSFVLSVAVVLVWLVIFRLWIQSDEEKTLTV